MTLNDVCDQPLFEILDTFSTTYLDDDDVNATTGDKAYAASEDN